MSIFDPRIPRPLQYLLRGLHAPYKSGLETEQVVGQVDDVAEFLHSTPEMGGLRSMTVLDEDGEILGVVSGRSQSTFAQPQWRLPWGRILDQPKRESHGILTFRVDDEASRRARRDLMTPNPETNVRPVTIDLSVAYAGIDPALFKREEVLFISAVLSADLSLTFESRIEQNGMKQTSFSRSTWRVGAPVPLDGPVLDILWELAVNVKPLFMGDSLLDRTDLICAATAIYYQSPLYTVKPEAYEGLRGFKLKIVEYGPVRNKKAVGDPESQGNEPRRPVSDFGWHRQPAPDDDTLRGIYRRGKPFDASVVALLRQAHIDQEDLSSLVGDILLDIHNPDLSWKIGLLDHAPEYLDAVPKAGAARFGLPLDALHVIPLTNGHPDHEQIVEWALRAQALWGTWPDDASSEVLQDLAQDPTDERGLAHYAAYLAMAGVPEAVIEREVDAVKTGAVIPSLERIESLRGGAH